MGVDMIKINDLKDTKDMPVGTKFYYVPLDKVLKIVNARGTVGGISDFECEFNCGQGQSSIMYCIGSKRYDGIDIHYIEVKELTKMNKEDIQHKIKAFKDSINELNKIIDKGSYSTVQLPVDWRNDEPRSVTICNKKLIKKFYCKARRDFVKKVNKLSNKLEGCE